MSITGLINSIGCIPEIEDNLRKKILVLSNNSTRVVYDLKGDDVINICRYCGELFSVCKCDRVRHVFEYLDNEKTHGHCVNCLETFAPNGTGSDTTPIITFLINLFSWFNRWVASISDKHDIGYWEGNTWVRKGIEDDNMLERTNNKIDRTWYLRPKSLWKKRAKVNWLAVDKCGDDSFNFSGCVCEKINS